MPNFKQRSYEEEIMDDLDLQGEELAGTLRQLAKVNYWLGGTGVALQGVKRLVKQQASGPSQLKIIDMGCGGGEILREIARWGRKRGIAMQLIGIDANAFTLDFARAQCKDFPEIQFQQINVFANEFAELEYDIALCSLFLHHFKEDEIQQLLQTMQQSARLGVIVNDLQRSALAYYLFVLVTNVVGASKMVKHDGLLSIRRGFKKRELTTLIKQSKINDYSIRWKWAFRYQVITSSKMR